MVGRRFRSVQTAISVVSVGISLQRAAMSKDQLQSDDLAMAIYSTGWLFFASLCLRLTPFEASRRSIRAVPDATKVYFDSSEWTVNRCMDEWMAARSRHGMAWHLEAWQCTVQKHIS